MEDYYNDIVDYIPEYIETEKTEEELKQDAVNHVTESILGFTL